MKQFLLILLSVLLLSVGCQQSYAAFPVRTKAQTETTTATTPATTQHVHKNRFKAFREFKKMVSPMMGEHRAAKPGWPGIVAFISSLLALVCFILPVVGLFFLFALAGIIFGAIGLNSRKYSNNGLAIAGMVMGILEIVLVLVLAIVIAAIIF